MPDQLQATLSEEQKVKLRIAEDCENAIETLLENDLTEEVVRKAKGFIDRAYSRFNYFKEEGRG